MNPFVRMWDELRWFVSPPVSRRSPMVVRMVDVMKTAKFVTGVEILRRTRKDLPEGRSRRDFDRTMLLIASELEAAGMFHAASAVRWLLKEEDPS